MSVGGSIINSPAVVLFGDPELNACEILAKDGISRKSVRPNLIPLSRFCWHKQVYLIMYSK
jgi:hypothetical protein